jgi:DNA-binding transcriptional LysR family regulator
LVQASLELAKIPEMGGVQIPLYRYAALRHLRALVATIDYGSATSAATILGHSTTAVARAIRDIEALVGVELFDRRSGHMVPTVTGICLLHHAKRILHELRYVREDMVAWSGIIHGHLAIGSTPLARSFLVPEALSRVAKAHPNLTFSIVEGPYGTLLDALQCGDLDVIVGALREPAPAKNVQEETLYQTPLSMIVRRGHPLSGMASISMEELSKASWVVPPKGTPTRGHFEHFFQKSGFLIPKLIVECSSSVATRELLLRNDWIAIVTRQQIHFEEQFGVFEILPVELQATARPIGVTARADTSLSPAATAFVGCLRSISKEGLTP